MRKEWESSDLQERKKRFFCFLSLRASAGHRPAVCVLAFFSVVASYSNLST